MRDMGIGVKRNIRDGIVVAHEEGPDAQMLVNGTISPFDLVMPSENAHFFVCPEETANWPKIQLFRDWIIKEAAV